MWILHYRSEAVAGVAVNVVVKLINILPSPSFQQYMLDFVLPLMLLLSSHELEVAISCSTALNMILSSLNLKKESQVWYMLKETKSVASIIKNLRNFSAETMPIEYFREMASLLSVILRRWPPSRYAVWNDTEMMKVLEAQQANPVLTAKVAVLKVYSSLGTNYHLVDFLFLLSFVEDNFLTLSKYQLYVVMGLGSLWRIEKLFYR